MGALPPSSAPPGKQTLLKSPDETDNAYVCLKLNHALLEVL